MRNGVLKTHNAAPAGTLESLEVIPFNAESDIFKEQTECCICMAAFDGAEKIRVTKCRHAFHSRCVGNWLKVNSTCPLCRSSLVPGDATDAAPPEAESGSTVCVPARTIGRAAEA